MRQRFYDRYVDRVFSLVRLTEAQDPFFAALDAHLPQYRAIQTPDAHHARRRGPRDPADHAAEDRRHPPEHALGADRRSGHVVYLEKPDAFWPRLRTFMEQRA